MLSVSGATPCIATVCHFGIVHRSVFVHCNSRVAYVWRQQFDITKISTYEFRRLHSIALWHQVQRISAETASQERQMYKYSINMHDLRNG